MQVLRATRSRRTIGKARRQGTGVVRERLFWNEVAGWRSTGRTYACCPFLSTPSGCSLNRRITVVLYLPTRAETCRRPPVRLEGNRIRREVLRAPREYSTNIPPTLLVRSLAPHTLPRVSHYPARPTRPHATPPPVCQPVGNATFPPRHTTGVSLGQRSPSCFSFLA